MVEKKRTMFLNYPIHEGRPRPLPWSASLFEPSILHGNIAGKRTCSGSESRQDGQRTDVLSPPSECEAVIEEVRLPNVLRCPALPPAAKSLGQGVTNTKTHTSTMLSREAGHGLQWAPEVTEDAPHRCRTVPVLGRCCRVQVRLYGVIASRPYPRTERRCQSAIVEEAPKLRWP